MARGKKAPPEVRALAEALYRESYPTAQVQDMVQQVTGERVDASTLRRWRLSLRAGETGDGARVYAELAKRLTRADLVRGFRVVMEVAAQVWPEMSHLSLEHLSRIVVLKVWARQCGWPDFEHLANSWAYQWEALGRLRDEFPQDDDRVHRALSYLWSIEGEVGSEALAHAWDLREGRRRLAPTLATGSGQQEAG